MNSIRLFRPLAPLYGVLMISASQATTHSVLPDTSIQAKIDLAVDGDIIAIFGGTYFEDIVINKQVRLVEVNGQDVHLAGSVTFDGVADCPPFVGFEVGPTKGIVVNDCTGLVIAGASIASLAQNSGELSVNSSTIAGNFDTLDNATKTVAFRVAVTGDCNWRSSRSWFGYGKARSFNFFGSNAKVVFLGSEIDRLGSESVGMNLEGTSNSYLITNCNIHDIRQANSDGPNSDNAIEIGGVGNHAVIQNNYFKLMGPTSYYCNGIEVSAGVSVVIRNNIMVGSVRFSSAPSGSTIENNHVVDGRFAVDGGAVGISFTSGDPLFVNADPYQLGEGSPCINAGTPYPRFNDRNGSRNDIGPSGGAWFDPDGWTTENPVVISFDLLPDQVVEGVDAKVILDGTQAASAP